MIKRDVQTPKGQQPNALKTGGFSFNTGQQQYTPDELDNFSFMRDVMPGLTAVTKDVMGQANQQAFLQGQADRASISTDVTTSAQMIEERSWLTRDSYAQGVKYNDYTEAQLATQAGISRQAQESVLKGESLEAFTQKVKPNLAKLTNKISDLGLTGKAKEAALNEVIEYTTVAQKAYQGALEVRTEYLFNDGMAKTAAGMTNTLAQAPDELSAAGVAMGGWDSMYQAAVLFDPTTGADTAGKNFVSAIKLWSNKMNPNSPQDVARLNGLLTFLHDPSSNNMPADQHAALSEALDGVRVEINNTDNLVRLDNMKRLETVGAVSGVYDIDSASRVRDDAMVALREHRISPNQFNTLNDKYYNFIEQANKNGGNNIKMYGSVPPQDQKKQSKFLIEQTIGKYGNAPEVIVPKLMEMANQYSSPTLMKDAATLVSSPAVVALSAGGDALRVNTEGQGLQSHSYETFKQMWGTWGQAGESHKQDALLASIPDGYSSETMRILMDHYPQLSAADAADKYTVLYDKLRQTQQSQLNRAVVTNDTLDDMPWGQLLGNTTSAQVGYERKPAIQAMHVNDINLALSANRNWLLSESAVYSDDKGAVRVAVNNGLIVNTRTGPVAVPKEAYDTYSTTDAKGRKIKMTPSGMVRMIDAVKDRMILDLGDSDPVFLLPDNKVEPENIYTEFKGGRLLLTAMDDDGGKIGQTQVFDRDELLPYTEVQPTAGETLVGSAFNKTTNGRNGQTQSWIIPENKGSFGDNLTKAAISKHRINAEGYFTHLSEPKTPKKVDGKVVPWTEGEYLIGNSIQKQTLVQHLGAEQAARYIELASDVGNPEFQLLDDQFQESYHKPLLPAIEKAGLPLPGTRGILNPNSRDGTVLRDYTPQYVAMSDALYHGGYGGLQTMTTIMQLARSGPAGKRDAIAMLEKASFYKQSGTRRAKSLRDSVESL